ncbi:transmembrane amino acid transporter protein [Onchocerca flexuosa]|uniref:Transmembrane amino acid transporter protein n=2 Tax=Onchocerca flexuosa TaxID=387005 RepID=A0A238BQG0_9BILA|nr:transmembrane amino acid transporter protein [Onchocerca flexuosa]
MYTALKRRDEYDRSDQANIDRLFLSKFNHWPHIFNLANCIVGVSMLAMPYCLQQCGILLGTILIGICSILTKLTCHLLYQGALLTRRRSYESMASHAFGNGGKRLVELLMILFLMSCIVSFMVVIGDIGPHVLADYLELQAPTQRLRILVMVVIFLFIILPLSLFRSVTSLSRINSITILFYTVFVLRMILECIPRIFDFNWIGNIRWWRQEGLLNSLPIISMALSCQTQLFCVTDCIKEPSVAKMDMIVSGAVNICSSMYTAVGLFGYIAFYDVELYGDILLYLQNSLLTQLLKLAFMLSVAVSIPLMLFPGRIAFYNFLMKPDACEFAMLRVPSLIFISLTVFLLSSCLLVAVIVPNVEFILGITGATIGSLVTIIIPSLLFLSISRGIEQYRSLIFYAKVSIIIGSLMLIGSTWAVLHTEQETNVVDIILPKRIDDEKVEIALRHLEKNTFSERKQKEEAVRSRKGRKKKQSVEVVTNQETTTVSGEIKEQRKEQDKILKGQEMTVDKLKKHNEMLEKITVTMAGISKEDVNVKQTKEIKTG